MVFFTCNKCGESLKKKDVDKHCSTRCRGSPFLTCVDCLKDFRDDFVNHTVCISEDDRYGAKGLNGLAKKPKSKQQLWVETVHTTLSKAIDDGIPGLTPSISQLMTYLLGQAMFPDKLKAFTNFVKNSRRSEPQQNIEFVWKILEKARTDLQATLQAEREAAEAAKKKAKEEKLAETNNKKNDDASKSLEKSKDSSDVDEEDDDDEKKEDHKEMNGKSNTGDKQLGSANPGKTEKKKKKRVDSECEPALTNVDFASSLVQNNNRKKKKKKSNSECEQNGKSVEKPVPSPEPTANKENLENSAETTTKLSKKEMKEKKKREKYEAELSEINKANVEESNENGEVKEAKNEEDTEEKMKKKKNKKKDKQAANNEGGQTTEAEAILNKREKKSKKRRREEADEGDECHQNGVDDKSVKKKSKQNGVADVKNLEQEEPAPEVPTKFDWDETIMKVLQQHDNEISVKRLCKKVVNEYLANAGDSYVDELKITSKFNKRLSKLHNVLVHKDKVKIKSSRD